MTYTEGPIHERTDTIIETPPTSIEVPVDSEVLSPAPAIAAGQVRVAYTSRWAPDAIIAAIGGLVLLVVGLIAITRGGLDRSMSEPVVTVLWFNHTSTLGLIEIAIGLCLLISGAAHSRSAATFFGTVLGIAGFVGAVQTSSFERSLALESSVAWLAVFAGAAIALSALTMPRFVRHTTTVERV